MTRFELLRTLCGSQVLFLTELHKNNSQNCIVICRELANSVQENNNNNTAATTTAAAKATSASMNWLDREKHTQTYIDSQRDPLNKTQTTHNT